jgi:hypothetical protein
MDELLIERIVGSGEPQVVVNHSLIVNSAKYVEALRTCAIVVLLFPAVLAISYPHAAIADQRILFGLVFIESPVVNDSH